jgi:mevalonate kinase
MVNKMEQQNISNPHEDLRSNFNYIIDVNKFLVCKLTQNWSHLFFDTENAENLCENSEFDDLFIELKRTFSGDDVYERKRSLLNKNGLDGTLLEMKVQLLQQLFENFQNHPTKESLKELIDKNILILKSLGNIYTVFHVIIELMEYLESLMIQEKRAAS